MYLIVFAPVYGPSGYAKLSRSFILGLDKLGVKIKLEPNKLWEPHETILPSATEKRLRELEKTIIPNGYTPPKLSIAIAPWFDQEYQGYKIGYTMFEFANVPNVGKYDWVSACLKMDEVWVPSNYNIKTFHDNGIHNVHIVEPGIDVEEFSSKVKPFIEKDDRFRFLSISEYTARKGFDLLIPAYLAEFNATDKVSLILKTYNGSKSVEESKRKIKEDIIKYRQESPNASYPHILFIGDILSSDKLPSLYTSADAFALFTRGEGWGLPFCEAMSCGLPCIAPNNSSYVDFINKNNGYLIDVIGFEKYSELYKASILYQNSESPIIDINQARKILRQAFNNAAEVKKKGKNAEKTIKENYTEDLAAKRMFEKLKNLNLYWKNKVVNIVTDNFDELSLSTDSKEVPGTTETSTLNINVVGTDNSNITVAMVIPTWGENCGVADYTVKLVEKLKVKVNVNIIKNVYNVIDTVQRDGIKLVHFQHHYAFYNISKLNDIIDSLKMMGVKVIMTVHDYAYDAKMKLQNSCFIKCDKIFTHSTMIKNKMVEDEVVNFYSTDVIIMGAEQPYKLDKLTAKSNIGLEGRRIISSFGFLNPHKNWVEVIKAISEIKKEIPDILYLLISVVKKGQPTIDQYDQLLDSTIKRLNLDNNVKRFKNYLSEERVLQMLAASDAIVLPYSNYRINQVEYWGVSIASRFSMRVQRPLIVSDSSFFSDLQNVSNVVAPTSSTITKNVLSLLKDENMQKKIVMNQYNFCLINSWESFRDKTVDAYREILRVS